MYSDNYIINFSKNTYDSNYIINIFDGCLPSNKIRTIAKDFYGLLTVSANYLPTIHGQNLGHHLIKFQ